MSRILLGAMDSWRGENEIICINSSIQQKLIECLLYPGYGGNVETCNNLSLTLCRMSWEHFHNQCFVWTSWCIMKWVWGIAISIVWWENWGSAKVPDSPKTINLRRREQSFTRCSTSWSDVLARMPGCPNACIVGAYKSIETRKTAVPIHPRSPRPPPLSVIHWENSPDSGYSHGYGWLQWKASK